jgi:DNA mismatch repair protein MutS
MPRSVVKRADEILQQLEDANRNSGNDVVSKPTKKMATEREGFQLSFFQLDDPVLEAIRDEIKNTDINNLTPIEALNKLNEIKRIITGKQK